MFFFGYTLLKRGAVPTSSSQAERDAAGRPDPTGGGGEAGEGVAGALHFDPVVIEGASEGPAYGRLGPSGRKLNWNGVKKVC